MALVLRLVNNGDTVPVTGDLDADWAKVAVMVTNYYYECGLPPTANENAIENCIEHYDGPSIGAKDTAVIEAVEV